MAERGIYLWKLEEGLSSKISNLNEIVPMVNRNGVPCAKSIAKVSQRVILFYPISVSLFYLAATWV